MPANGSPWQQPRAQAGALFFPSLGINGNDFAAPASDQEDPVQTLHEDFQELHIWGRSQGEEGAPFVHSRQIFAATPPSRTEGYSFRLLLCSWVVRACWAGPAEPPVTCWPPPHSASQPCACGARSTGSWRHKTTRRRSWNTLQCRQKEGFLKFRICIFNLWRLDLAISTLENAKQ